MFVKPLAVRSTAVTRTSFCVEGNSRVRIFLTCSSVKKRASSSADVGEIVPFIKVIYVQYITIQHVERDTSFIKVRRQDITSCPSSCVRRYLTQSLLVLLRVRCRAMVNWNRPNLTKSRVARSDPWRERAWRRPWWPELRP